MIKTVNLSKSFGNLKVLEELNINIGRGEFVVVLGANGCGKTTLLRIISGLEKPTKGNVLVSGEIGLIFQEPVLLPWRNVEKNIEFGLEIKNIKERAGIVKKYIEYLGLQQFKKYYPSELSGGMKQKVVIARTLAVNPSILLMDEPFSNLDAPTKEKLAIELVEMWKKIKKTVIFVTHNIEEAIFLADRIILLGGRPGKIIKEFNIRVEREKRKYNKKIGETKKDISKILLLNKF